MSDVVTRRAARAVLFEPAGRVLLMNWRDPVTGRSILEPPGGGPEEDEGPIEAARRELFEELGREFELSEQWAVDCERDTFWAGRRVRASERFYGAHVTEAFAAVPSAFTASEVATFLGTRWLSLAELAAGNLPGELEPPNLIELIETLRGGSIGADALSSGAPAR